MNRATIAAHANATAQEVKAHANPWRSLSTPIVAGASALKPRPTLYEIPRAVARMDVGNSSPPIKPEAVKKPVPRNAAIQAKTRTRAGFRARANSGTAPAAATR